MGKDKRKGRSWSDSERSESPVQANDSKHNYTHSLTVGNDASWYKDWSVPKRNVSKVDARALKQVVHRPVARSKSMDPTIG